MNILLIVQIVISIALISFILLQVKGTGFGRVWGSFSASSTRRGVEDLVFKLTFVLMIVFLAISTITLFI